ncbi:hypothetical protein N7519_005784 [Penicillium mononematosum]|uniref:uncharacterized protein n=1 Tax=Penicillium mononematosum TaxID=268346 RepID=UPI00254966A0|nr:uncharacterized protein N7519_005784 [Penicillium mononematosum]KAJ6184483.1 hypothetical protein N7519_005784 [Penicillium mononematosum]
MAFFVPTITASKTDNEFGPGVYTTSSLQHALKYVTRQGALMVFQNADFQHIKLWEPSEDDWRVIIRSWSGLPPSDAAIRVPEQWKNADIIKGPISCAGGIPEPARVPGPDAQVVGVSYAGCAALAASLKMIIWFE